jgi:hypothetical protein
MRTLLLPLLITFAFFHTGKSQVKSSSKEFFSKEFNWTIQIPEGFEPVSAEEWKKMQNRGLEAIEKTYDTEVENMAKTIFVVKNGLFNYFEANYQPFNKEKDGDYLESFKEVNSIVYGTFEAQMPNAKLDSASSQETIDGKVFQTFKVTITVPNIIVMEFLMYSRLFGDKEFTVNSLTVDKEKRRVLLEAWRSSKFGK